MNATLNTYEAQLLVLETISAIDAMIDRMHETNAIADEIHEDNFALHIYAFVAYDVWEGHYLHFEYWNWGEQRATGSYEDIVAQIAIDALNGAIQER